MTRLVLAAVLVLPVTAQPPPVRVHELPRPTETTAGQLGAGTVFEGPDRWLYMVVTPPTDPPFPGNRNFVLWGIADQPKAVPGGVYVVELASGSLMVMPSDSWARVATARIDVKVFPDE